jgi:hypothetical protein
MSNKSNRVILTANSANHGSSSESILENQPRNSICSNAGYVDSDIWMSNSSTQQQQLPPNYSQVSSLSPTECNYNPPNYFDLFIKSKSFHENNLSIESFDT